MNQELRVATDEAWVLAEGPFWDAPRERLLWVDIEAGLVMTGVLRDDGSIEVVDRVRFGDRVGAVAPAADGSWIVAVGDRLLVRDAAGAITEGPVLLTAGRRLNDGKPDPAGRFLVGSLPLEGLSSDEELFVVVDGGIRVLDSDLTLSNGLAWSLDGRVLYSIDTERYAVFRRDWDPDTGAAGARELAFTVEGGFPDGMTIDAEGNLWIAVWGAAEVRRYTPAGELLDTIIVPVPYVSSVAFAGPGLRTLVITTSFRDLSPDERARHPHAGKLFTLGPGVAGAAQPLWRGAPDAVAGSR